MPSLPADAGMYCTFGLNLPTSNWGQIHRDPWCVGKPTYFTYGCVDYLVWWWLNYHGSPRNRKICHDIAGSFGPEFALNSKVRLNRDLIYQLYYYLLSRSNKSAQLWPVISRSIIYVPKPRPQVGLAIGFDSPYNIIWLGFESELLILIF